MFLVYLNGGEVELALSRAVVVAERDRVRLWDLGS